MTTRYFKATDGKRTVYRSSESREYATAFIASDGNLFSFSNRTGYAGAVPAVEIDKTEWLQLRALKLKRLQKRWAEIDRRVHHMDKPGDSWVYNADLEAAQ